MPKKVQSVEPSVTDEMHKQLGSYKGVKHYPQQEHINNDPNHPVEKALNTYVSKTGGTGGNRPDAKMIIHLEGKVYPIVLEYKGYEDKLVMLDAQGFVDNRKTTGEPNIKNISQYAVNGAVHYANAIIHHTEHKNVVAVGVTGYRDAQGDLQTKIGVSFVTADNFGAAKLLDKAFTDLSFLKVENQKTFIEECLQAQLSPAELSSIKQAREQEIDFSLKKLNNDIYNSEKGLSENDRVYLVAATIIATLGAGPQCPPLEVADLRSSQEEGSRDGDIILRKIRSFLNQKRVPEEKKNTIINSMQSILLAENTNRVFGDGTESQLKRVFRKIEENLGVYYKSGMSIDFTGKLFNEMYSWLGFAQDKLNDVVLTPSYVCGLLVKLARINRDSYVWDYATGSAGLLVAAMNEMLIDAKENISSPDELAKRERRIRGEQLLGLEILQNVYVLAVLNMIMMGDGSSYILNKDSLLEFDGTYGPDKNNEPFPATAFILNPPYSAEGNGMVFVERGLNMMQHSGYAAIIIQASAGSGKAAEINKRILEKHTLVASIKMPSDIFSGKASVQTQVYVFKVNEAHDADGTVKFINFANDGYTRSNRKKASNNLKDTDHATERYQEIVELVKHGSRKLHYFTKDDYYEGFIDPTNGCDWNQSAPIDTTPTLEDFKKTVGDYLAWEVSNLLEKARV